MISVDWVQPIGRAASDAARWRIAVAPLGWTCKPGGHLVGNAQLLQDFGDVNPGGGLLVSGTKIASAPRKVARRLAASFDRHQGIAGAHRHGGLDQADVGYRIAGDEIFAGKIRDQRRRQYDDVGRRALAQFAGHGADRAELAFDIEAGLCLECGREAFDQALGGAAAENVERAHDVNSIAAIRLSRVIGRVANPHAQRIEHGVGDRSCDRAVRGLAGADRLDVGPGNDLDLDFRHFAEAKDRIFRP